jgi:uncharacterized Zn-binding protein involved in type VI secretion
MGAIAIKQGDKVIGQDTHMMIPAGAPSPVQVILPFNGMLNSGVSSNVYIHAKPAAVAGTGGTNIPPHIPPGGSFVKAPSNVCKILQGSNTVKINKKPAARVTDPVQTCNDPADKPGAKLSPVGPVKVFIG